MRRLLSRLQDPLPRLLLAPSKAKYNDATQKLITYLATVTASSVLASLDDALSTLFGSNTKFVDQLFEQYASRTADGHRFWHRSNFVQFAATRLGHHDLLHSSSSMLWHIFSSAAYYPFQATASLIIPSEEDIQLGRLAFRRAFALLVLRGWELSPSDDEKDGYTMIVAMDDLQKLMQLLLLIRQGSEVWRIGQASQQTNIYSARFDLGDAETTQASRHAETLLGKQFGSSAQHLKVEQMTQWSMDIPCVLLSLFQVWTALFVPAYPDLSRNKRPFSISMINVFCLTNSTSFLKKPDRASRTLMGEWSMSRSLQHAEGVADTATTDLFGSEMRQILMVNQQDFFVLLFRDQDVSVAGSLDPEIERSFAAFGNSVPDEPLRIKQDGDGRLASFVWRTSVMQLQPNIVMGDGMGSGARVDGELLQLFSRESAGGSSTNVVIDLERKTVVVAGLNLSAQFRMSLRRLRCYRIPRDSAL